jgi:hypothetical protein
MTSGAKKGGIDMVEHIDYVQKASMHISDQEAAQMASELLTMLEQRPELFDTEDGRYFNMNLTRSNDPGYSPELEAAEILCWHFVRSEGGLRSGVSKILESVGIRIFPLEKDSFGWLSGGMQKGNGHIVVFC